MATTFDDLPNELLAHVLRMGLDRDGHSDAFLAAARATSRRWHDAASTFWRPVAPHAYGRCLQFLKDTDNNWLVRPRKRHLTKRQIVAKAIAGARYAEAEAGPAFDAVELRPYDYATALVEVFGADAPESAQHRWVDERCPACGERPDRCACLCGDYECWPCKGGRPLARCKRAHGDKWSRDYPGGWDGDADNGGCLASQYPRLAEAVERHRVATASRWANMRWPTLAHWDATDASPAKAAVYVARCAQTLVTHALADADDIGRMTCSAVVRRAHRLNDYRACVRDPVWHIGDCRCGQWTFGEKRCACDNVKYYYSTGDVEVDSAYCLDDVSSRHGSIKHG
ncbi:hypothetical protein [Pandoravirus japonicus]|uniref:F-box domain-containing protein n=1 Tax=Pandoravirus japonicus TaxID=2823154 RepID=A0A811BQN3_9VIRU|nr:hypothetical protein [Pandoravirus japonicus]